jgi:hypothetical protein
MKGVPSDLKQDAITGREAAAESHALLEIAVS